MAVGDVYQLVRTVEIDGEEHVNVMHFQDVQGIAQDPEEALMDAWDEDGQVCPELYMRQFQTGAESYVPISLACQRISPTKGEAVVRGLTDRIVSTADGLPTINQVSILISTARTDRSGKGAMRIGGLREVSVTGNILNSSGQALLDPLLQALVDWWTENGAEFIGFVLGVWSKKLLEFNAATSVSNAQVIGSMVTRRPGRGN